MPKRAREGALTEVLRALGRRLRELRVSAGFTQEKAAQAIGVSAQAVRNWEAGRHEPNAERLNRLANLYGVTKDELLGSGSKASVSDEGWATAVQFKGYLATGPEQHIGPVEGGHASLAELVASERSRTFALVVSGDSLSAHGIQDGDLILVDPYGELGMSGLEPYNHHGTLPGLTQTVDGREVEFSGSRPAGPANGNSAGGAQSLGRVIWHLRRM